MEIVGNVNHPGMGMDAVFRETFCEATKSAISDSLSAIAHIYDSQPFLRPQYIGQCNQPLVKMDAVCSHNG
jgi:hypothetical protein